MPTVRVEDEVFEGLQKLARPFVDTPSSVIRRLLEEKGVLAKAASRDPLVESRSTPKSNGEGLTPQPVYEKYLLTTLAKDFKGRGHKREVTQIVLEKMKADGHIAAADLELVATGETKAENTVAWGRNALKERGHISKLSPRGTWELTPEGLEAAKYVPIIRGTKK